MRRRSVCSESLESEGSFAERLLASRVHRPVPFETALALHALLGAATDAALERLETCWRMRGPRGRILACGIYRDDGPGFDVRAGYGEEDLVRSQRTADLDVARAIAETWRQAVLAKGTFTPPVLSSTANTGAGPSGNRSDPSAWHPRTRTHPQVAPHTP